MRITQLLNWMAVPVLGEEGFGLDSAGMNDIGDFTGPPPSGGTGGDYDALSGERLNGDLPNAAGDGFGVGPGGEYSAFTGERSRDYETEVRPAMDRLLRAMPGDRLVRHDPRMLRAVRRFAGSFFQAPALEQGMETTDPALLEIPTPKLDRVKQGVQHVQKHAGTLEDGTPKIDRITGGIKKIRSGLQQRRSRRGART